MKIISESSSKGWTVPSALLKKVQKDTVTVVGWLGRVSIMWLGHQNLLPIFGSSFDSYRSTLLSCPLLQCRSTAGAGTKVGGTTPFHRSWDSGSRYETGLYQGQGGLLAGTSPDRVVSIGSIGGYLFYLWAGYVLVVRRVLPQNW